MKIEQGQGAPVVENGQGVREPKTFVEKEAFLNEMTSEYLHGKISFQDLRFYERKYGLASTEPGSKK